MKITPELLEQMGFEKHVCEPGGSWFSERPWIRSLYRLKLMGYEFVFIARNDMPGTWEFRVGEGEFRMITDLEEIFPHLFMEGIEAGKEELRKEIKETLQIR